MSLQSAEAFTPYGPLHWAMLATTVVGAVVLVRYGRRSRGTPNGRYVARVMAIVLLAITAGFQVYWLLPQNFDIQQSLPLHMSDVLRLVAAYALWSGRRWAVAVTYFWGLTFNTQAMLTPSLSKDSIPLLEITSYWSLHILVMWAVIYLAWGLGRYPDWRRYGSTLVITVVWAGVVFGINSALGTNYGYLNEKPAGASLLDVMGGWPVYLLVVLALMVPAWALMTCPWMLARRRAVERATTAAHQVSKG